MTRCASCSRAIVGAHLWSPSGVVCGVKCCERVLRAGHRPWLYVPPTMYGTRLAPSQYGEVCPCLDAKCASYRAWQVVRMEQGATT